MPVIEKESGAAARPETLQEASPAAPERPRQESPSAESAVEAPSVETIKEHLGETPASPIQDGSPPSAPARLTVNDLLKEPARIRALSPEEQVNIILDLVVQKKFPAAHGFIEQLGKKEDLAFYAWLEDSLHDAATREDWRKFIQTQA